MVLKVSLSPLALSLTSHGPGSLRPIQYSSEGPETMKGLAMFNSKLAILCISLFVFGGSRPGSAFVTGNNNNEFHQSQSLAKSRRQSHLYKKTRGVPTAKQKRRRFLALGSSSQEEETATSTTTTIDKPTIIPSSADDDTTSSGLIVSSSRFSISEENLGLLALFTVPMVWGTYVPVVRTLYEIEPPVPGLVFSACYFAVASISTLALVAFQRSGEEDDDAVPATPSSLEETTSESKIGISTPIVAGLELGTYLFLGNSLQVIGLKTVPSDRAGFLVQRKLTTLPAMCRDQYVSVSPPANDCVSFCLSQ
jgi:hypothetical protein